MGLRARGMSLLIAMSLCLLGPATGAGAITESWSVATRFTDAAGTTFQHRPASAETAQQAAFELSARHPRGDAPRGRAAAAVKARFSGVIADNVVIIYFGRNQEAANDPVAQLRVYVHCDGEIEDDWAFVGRKDVLPSTSGDTMAKSITPEDCETQLIDGLMLQVLTGEANDRRRRTVFLRRAELRQSATPVWTEDFTVP